MMFHSRQRPIAEEPFGLSSRFFWLSLLGHLALLAVFSLTHFFGWFYAPMQVYQRAIRVDVVGLPDKLPDFSTLPVNQESKPVRDSIKQEPSVSSVAVPPKNKFEVPMSEKTAVTEKKNANSLKKENLSKERLQAMKSLKQWQALAAIESQVHQQEANLKQLRQLVFKGNKIIDGSSLTGIEKLEIEEYVDKVEAHVKSYWTLPQWLARKKLRAKALVKWDSRGIPTMIQIIESSGNDEFDEIVIVTLQKATPFPVPPEKFILMVRQQGVLFGFPE